MQIIIGCNLLKKMLYFAGKPYKNYFLGGCSVKKNRNRVIFENIGGSFQFNIRRAEDLRKVLELDETVWAALCVPVNSLNGDREFFNALDCDGNGMVRVDEVKIAIRWLLSILTDSKVIDARQGALDINVLNRNNPEADGLYKFVQEHKTELLDEKNFIHLAGIRTKLSAVTTGTLDGSGTLRLTAVENSDARELFENLTGLLNSSGTLTSPQLEKFAVDAESFIQWSRITEKPSFRGDDPVEYFTVFQSLEHKIDEFFRFCDLICVDPAHAERFSLDPKNLPPLDLQNNEDICKILKAAPLAAPHNGQVLYFDRINNPEYAAAAEAFATKFKLSALDRADWQKLKDDFAPYIDYLARASGDTAGKLGSSKLEKLLAGEGFTALRELFIRDKALGGIVENLRKLERLLLYCQYMLEFVNNFVSFEAFFDPDKISMLQAGRLIMDGKSYNLAVWIDNIANHKKIAVRSGMCLIYLEVASSGQASVTRRLAVAITGGSTARIYVGKPAFFMDNDNITYHGKIVDMVDGPISFGQTVCAPFRRLSEAISNKMQKLTDFSSTEKELNQAIDKGKMPAAKPLPPTQAADVPFTQRMFSNHSVMLLAGGLSLAAIGAGFSFILKAITGAVTAISAQRWYVIVIWIAVLLGIVLVPMAIFAFLRMRKRNVTMFLEAGGWAVNLPMRLSMHVSGIFTRSAEYPPHTLFKAIKAPRRPRGILFTLLVLLVLAAAAAALWYLERAKGC